MVIESWKNGLKKHLHKQKYQPGCDTTNSTSELRKNLIIAKTKYLSIKQQPYQKLLYINIIIAILYDYKYTRLKKCKKGCQKIVPN